MKLNLLISSFLIGLSVISTFFLIKLTLKKGIIDVPNERSSHKSPTPRGGGLSIAIIWYVLIFVLLKVGKIELNLFLALFSGIILSIISFIDDIININPKIRLIAQILSSLSALFFLGGLQIINLGFTILNIPLIVNLLVLIGIIWAINLFNFLDGIDGYLGSEGVFIFSALFIFVGDVNTLYFAAIILGFLFLNWPKAKIFCGDVGSTLIGFNLAIFAIYYQNTSQLSILIPIVLSGLFWVDATITLFRRIKDNEKISDAHKKHAYQRLHQSGFSHLKVLLIGIFINIVLLIIASIGILFSEYLPLIFLLQIIVMYLYIKFADKRKK